MNTSKIPTCYWHDYMQNHAFNRAKIQGFFTVLPLFQNQDYKSAKKAAVDKKL